MFSRFHQKHGRFLAVLAWQSLLGTPNRRTPRRERYYVPIDHALFIVQALGLQQERYARRRFYAWEHLVGMSRSGFSVIGITVYFRGSASGAGECHHEKTLHIGSNDVRARGPYYSLYTKICRAKTPFQQTSMLPHKLIQRQLPPLGVF